MPKLPTVHTLDTELAQNPLREGELLVFQALYTDDAGHSYCVRGSIRTDRAGAIIWRDRGGVERTEGKLVLTRYELRSGNKWVRIQGNPEPISANLVEFPTAGRKRKKLPFWLRMLVENSD